jgi:hypothetical protein
MDAPVARLQPLRVACTRAEHDATSLARPCDCHRHHRFGSGAAASRDGLVRRKALHSQALRTLARAAAHIRDAP